MNPSTNTNILLDTLSAMCRQEEAGYKTSASLYQSQPQQSSANGPLNSDTVDVECRDKMAAWCFQVVDFCKFSRETVSIAMNYLDRFMASPSGRAARNDRKLFQLAAMTCLYTAVKIHEPEAMDPKLVSTLSRGTYSPQEVEAMEAMILPALQWKLNPPTALAFCRQFLELLPTDVVEPYQREAVYDLTKFQTELAVSECDFVNVKSSVVGYCALINALESIGMDPKALSYISIVLSESIQLHAQNDSVYEVQNWLYKAVLQQPTSSEGFTTQQPASSGTGCSPNKGMHQRRSSVEISPRSSIAGAVQ